MKQSTPAVEWHPFNYRDKKNTRPQHEGLVWIVDYHAGDEVTLGHFDGYTMVNYFGSDDVSVSHWAEIAYPDPPARTGDDRDGDDD